MSKQRVTILLDSEELEKFRSNVVKPQLSSISREFNIFIKKENAKMENGKNE